MPYSAARFSAVTPIGQPAWLSVRVEVGVKVRVKVGVKVRVGAGEGRRGGPS